MVNMYRAISLVAFLAKVAALRFWLADPTVQVYAKAIYSVAGIKDSSGR
jgi:hypothetical protein